MYKDFLVIDNWYDKKELNYIYKELDFLSLKMLNSEQVEGPALDQNNKSKLKGFRIYPHDIYSEKGVEYSPVLQSLNKFKNKNFHKKVEKTFKNTSTALSEQFMGTNCSHTFINYYENDNFYKEHFDAFQFTALIFIFKQPKSFIGGDLHFTRINKKVECKNNRLVLFPSFYYHATKELKSKLNEGRYSIATFFSTRA